LTQLTKILLILLSLSSHIQDKRPDGFVSPHCAVCIKKTAHCITLTSLGLIRDIATLFCGDVILLISWPRAQWVAYDGWYWWTARSPTVRNH